MLCCVDSGDSLGNLKDTSIENIRKGEKFTYIREAFLEGKKLDRCKTCWDSEKAGYKSYRQSCNEHYKDYPELNREFRANEPLPILYLDFRPSNLCNLACKICNPDYSTKLIDPFHKIGFISDKSKNNYTKLNLNKISIKSIINHLDQVDQIYFAGGEPIISEDHWTLLDYLVENKKFNIRLRYNTNLTNLSFKDKNLVDYWKHFESVQVLASLDGYEKGFTHTRTGGDWNKILENLEELKKLSNIDIFCDSTVGWLNLKSTLRLHRYLIGKEYVMQDDPSVNKLIAKPVYEPVGASLYNTHPSLKEELIDAIEEQKIWSLQMFPKRAKLDLPNLDSLIYIVENSEFNEQEFINWMRINVELDNRYNLYTPDAFKFNTEFQEFFKFEYDKIAKSI